MKKVLLHLWIGFVRNLSLILKIAIILLIVFFIGVKIYYIIKTPLYDHNAIITQSHRISIEEIAALAIEKSNQAISIIQWFVITFITISAGLVVYFLKTFLSTNRELDVLRGQIKEASSILDQYMQINGHLQEILVSLPRRILPPSLAQDAMNRGLISPNDRDETYLWLSWQKWIILHDDTGYQTLMELSVDVLPTNLKIIILEEISLIQKQVQARHDKKIRREEREQLNKLQMLLERRSPNLNGKPSEKRNT